MLSKSKKLFGKWPRSSPGRFCSPRSIPRPAAPRGTWYPALPLPWERDSQVQPDELHNPLSFSKQISLSREHPGERRRRWGFQHAGLRQKVAWSHAVGRAGAWGRFWGKKWCLGAPGWCFSAGAGAGGGAVRLRAEPELVPKDGEAKEQ